MITVLGLVAWLAAGAWPVVGDRQATGTDTDPCSILTAQQVESALKVAVGPGIRTARVCRWRPSQGPGSVTLQIHATSGRAVYDNERKVLGVDEVLKGIGEEAFRSGLVVCARSGDRFFSLALAPNMSGPMPLPPDAIALAKTVAAKWLSSSSSR